MENTKRSIDTVKNPPTIEPDFKVETRKGGIWFLILEAYANIPPLGIRML
ncbi:hypothetical protein AciX8_3761 [Granulicella mallensis MP5ACTX8]|uniref:Uncharacterized protein n=2 Tax=Granulicella mallensis TaxID=940614 RepID=G8P0F7_GRAMM|nr:hypothetical protein AciX8_3761 [Granulicella mallensis MP5ACTX8]MBB5066747.1 hypothetical protein [Granulicella mallensis]